MPSPQIRAFRDQPTTASPPPPPNLSRHLHLIVRSEKHPNIQPQRPPPPLPAPHTLNPYWRAPVSGAARLIVAQGQRNAEAVIQALCRRGYTDSWPKDCGFNSPPPPPPRSRPLANICSANSNKNSFRFIFVSYFIFIYSGVQKSLAPLVKKPFTVYIPSEQKQTWPGTTLIHDTTWQHDQNNKERRKALWKSLGTRSVCTLLLLLGQLKLVDAFPFSRFEFSPVPPGRTPRAQKYSSASLHVRHVWDLSTDFQ